MVVVAERSFENNFTNISTPIDIRSFSLIRLVLVLSMSLSPSLNLETKQLLCITCIPVLLLAFGKDEEQNQRSGRVVFTQFLSVCKYLFSHVPLGKQQ